MEPKEINVGVIGKKALLALLIFFVETVDTNEPEALEVSFIKRKGGEPCTWGKGFRPNSVYPEGVYLKLSIKGDTDTYSDFQKIVPLFDTYIGGYYEDDGCGEYEFRLTDNADDEVTDKITPMYVFNDNLEGFFTEYQR